uniref:Uncharacterized protein n=1 Tax=Coccidioides posadasii RMSCC 3488 TaxID=454284 RepID=A0A0J6FD75_COCPO|nr:hypothetical protein CPAG_07373 [Coccidioides posadasii RMSCC 3488]
MCLRVFRVAQHANWPFFGSSLSGSLPQRDMPVQRRILWSTLEQKSHGLLPSWMLNVALLSNSVTIGSFPLFRPNYSVGGTPLHYGLEKYKMSCLEKTTSFAFELEPPDLAPFAS